MVKVTGSLQKSTEIMKLSSALIKLPQISQVMRDMSMEMTKVRLASSPQMPPLLTKALHIQAGIMEEMLDDTLEMEDDEELEEEADAEVDKVLFDVTNGKLGQAGTVHTETPVSAFYLLLFIFSDRIFRRHRKTLWTKKKRKERWNNIDSN